tara:strand:- start:12970 stop:13116 length:147 start_codon:yes stop_codon:yes gene_type:complete
MKKQQLIKEKKEDLLWELESLISMRGFHITVNDLVTFTNKCKPKKEVA